MASSKCSVVDCTRNSGNLCDHCQQQVCTKHYFEHVQLVNKELPTLSDQLNAMLSAMQEHDFTKYAFEQIEQWREESHRRIDSLCEERKEQVKMEIGEEVDVQLAKFRHISQELTGLINEGFASINDIENIKQNLEQCRRQWDLLGRNDRFRLDIKTINLGATLKNQEFFTGGGTLLSIEHQTKLNEFYGKEGQAWMLIYKATRDGFPSADFHRCCNNQGPTITVVQSTDGDYLFGGYTSVSWSTRQNYIQDDNGPFLFTLTNPHGIPPTKYKAKLRNLAVYDHLQNGPTFGAGHDLYVSSDSNTNQNSSINFPHSYGDTTKKGSTTFTGNKNFQTKDIEIYRPAQA